ncbi:succinate dehydrogenase assembly factor 2 [Propionivibrio dicarboxylicus]|uniref:FAD assembly factor SdhE n=1 Tax=Propionivibrio dicarboxylicus TaxID=83767 RepID=A0A1G7ZFJ3_9RHOO|nr:succinate dehydrogenase assembly factor 2 [Propionivibrio dicarboxylicus]SDH07511.1 antitoxin CptB [Propionivibrio dicarboxylicus]
MTTDETAYNRLRWICNQRSMREMDVVLGGFLERRFHELSPEQAEAFTRLAEMEDIDLWPLVSGRKNCDDPALAAMLVMLRDVRVK